MNPRQCAQTGLDLAQQFQAALLPGELPVTGGEERQHAVRIISGIDAAQFQKAAEHQARADE